MIGRVVIVWLGLLVSAVLNGAFREAVLVPWMGVDLAHAVSSVILSAIILAAVCILAPWIHIANVRHALVIGCAWLVMTVAFEFGFGRFVAHRDWSELLVDYNVFAGRIWILVLLTTVLAPLLAARVRHLLPRTS